MLNVVRHRGPEHPIDAVFAATHSRSAAYLEHGNEQKNVPFFSDPTMKPSLFFVPSHALHFSTFARPARCVYWHFLEQ